MGFGSRSKLVIHIIPADRSPAEVRQSRIFYSWLSLQNPFCSFAQSCQETKQQDPLKSPFPLPVLYLPTGQKPYWRGNLAWKAHAFSWCRPKFRRRSLGSLLCWHFPANCGSTLRTSWCERSQREEKDEMWRRTDVHFVYIFTRHTRIQLESLIYSSHASVCYRPFANNRRRMTSHLLWRQQQVLAQCEQPVSYWAIIELLVPYQSSCWGTVRSQTSKSEACHVFRENWYNFAIRILIVHILA